ncbi:hypothetical protein BV392_12380 [Rhodovulum sulfidophilum]|nr:hypothetical protein BV392_12380 [Rhodovulum sulfidophilum]
MARDARKARKAARRKAGPAAVVVALAIAAGGVWLEQPGLYQDMMASHVAARGERQSITLEDGSTVLLDAGSAIAEDFTACERRVRLLRGVWVFDVAKNGPPSSSRLRAARCACRERASTSGCWTRAAWSRWNMAWSRSRPGARTAPRLRCWNRVSSW